MAAERDTLRPSPAPAAELQQSGSDLMRPPTPPVSETAAAALPARDAPTPPRPAGSANTLAPASASGAASGSGRWLAVVVLAAGVLFLGFVWAWPGVWFILPLWSIPAAAVAADRRAREVDEA